MALVLASLPGQPRVGTLGQALFDALGPALRAGDDDQPWLGDPAAGAIARTNMVPNPSFRDGIAGWGTGSMSTTVALSRSADGFYGSGALLSEVSAGWETYPWCASDPIPGVVAGSYYSESAWLRMSSATARSWRLRLRFLDAGQVYISAAYSAITTVTADGWVKLSVTQQAPAGAAYIVVGLYYGSAGQSWSGTEAVLMDGVLLEQAANVGDFFDGDRPANARHVYAWTGTPGGSASVARAVVPVGLLAPARTNMVASNPSGEAGSTTGWAALSSTLAVNTTASPVPPFGLACLAATKTTTDPFGFQGQTVDAAPGLPYTASVYLMMGSPVPRRFKVRLQFANPDGSNPSYSYSGDIRIDADSWTRVSVTATAPATAGKATVSAYCADTGIAAGEVVLMDGAMLEQSDSLGSYFDGSTVPSAGTAYQWTGAANVSPSTAHPVVVPVGNLLLRLCDALAAPLDAIDDLIRDSDDYPGWAKALDVDAAPHGLLPWLGQFVGEGINPALPGDVARSRIRNRSRWGAGTLGSITAAIREHLGGTQRVEITERTTDAYHIRIRVLAAEVTDTAAVTAAAAAAKPAGLILDFQIVSGDTYARLLAVQATYTLAAAAWPAYNDEIFTTA